MPLVVGSAVVEWVGAMTGHPRTDAAIGIGYERDGKIVQGVIFTDYTGPSIQIHIACAEGSAFFPTFVAAVMDYPFVQLGCRRVTAFVAAKNLKSRILAEHFGGFLEGVMRDALDDDDLIVYGLLRRDAQQWLTARFSDRLKPYRSPDG
jgi:RimJ/RimL family protein N-acetyltransferase